MGVGSKIRFVVVLSASAKNRKKKKQTLTCGSCAPKPSACACEYLQFSLKHAPFKKSRHISSPPPPAPVEGESGFDKLLLNCILKTLLLSLPQFFFMCVCVVVVVVAAV